MSTLKTTFIQHPSSDEPNIELLATGGLSFPGAGYVYAGTVYFTSSGTFAKADPLSTGDIGLRAIRVRCQGSGGGGGGAETTGAGEVSRGGGGGGGGYAERFFTDIASLDSSVDVTVGAAGGGVSGAAGTAGGTSEFGGSGDAWRTRASGGGGGVTDGSKLPEIPSAGGSAGVGLSGEILAGGSRGLIGLSFTASAFRGNSGDGGPSIFGGGGGGVQYSGSTPSAGNGRGGGGGGAYNEASIGTAQAGAAGSAGIVIIDCFV